MYYLHNYCHSFFSFLSYKWRVRLDLSKLGFMHGCQLPRYDPLRCVSIHCRFRDDEYEEILQMKERYGSF